MMRGRADKESTIREIVRNANLAWRLFVDRRVPIAAKALPVLALGYLIWPVDLIPDIPILGQLDDLVVLLIALRVFIGLAPPELVEELRGARDRSSVDATYRVVDDEPPGGPATGTDIHALD